MRHTYSALSGLPSVHSRSAERKDPILALTGEAARQMLARLDSLAPSQKVDELNRALATVDPTLPDRVQRVAAFLARKGLKPSLAVERALALSLADAHIDRFKKIGEAYQQGGTPEGLGQTPVPTTPPTTPQGQDAGQIAGNIAQGIACSSDLRTAIVDLVGRDQGRTAADATTIGLSVGQGIANCPVTTPPAPPPPPPPPPPAPSLFWPAVIGIGSLAVVGGVVFFMRKR